MPNSDPSHNLDSGDLYQSEIRKHYFLDRYTIVAPKRNLRPDAFSGLAESHRLETVDSPQIENEPAIIEVNDQHGHWLIKVIDNAFPALKPDWSQAFGKQEIVIETPEHNVEFSALTVEHIEKIFQVYTDRVEELRQMPGIAYVVVFKNDGPKAGATLAHAHSQIFALPLVPPTVQIEAAGFDQYRRQHGSCPLCDTLAWEQQQQARLIAEDEHLLAFSPYAGSAPYGAWLVPKRHAHSFSGLNEAERRSYAQVLKQITAKLDAVNLSFNFFLQDSFNKLDYHFILKVEPRPNIWGGLELSTGVIINPVPPEYAAKWYRGLV
jgi:UDPglucose--hexose-1-phosphate uridylyltransferase